MSMSPEGSHRYRLFETVTGAHWGAAYGLILRMVSSRDAAEDILQDTLLRALKGFDGLRDHGAAKSWLLRIAHTTTLNWLRTNQRSVPIDFVDDLSPFDLGVHADGPHEHAERNDEAAAIGRMVDKLPPIYREIIQLRYTHEFSYRELAELIGIPMSSVKFRLHQAVKLLRGQVSRDSSNNGS